MAQSARCKLPYPNRGTKPYYDQFESFVQAVDASLYAAREDRNLILSGGGTFNVNEGTGDIDWDEDIDILSPITGLVWRIAPDAVQLDDGELLYVTLTRAPQTVTVVVPVVASNVPNEPRGDDHLILAWRHAGKVNFRNGFGGSSGGGAGTPAGTNGDVQVKNGAAFAAGYERHISNLRQGTKPRVGLATVYASEGRTTQAMADADQVLADTVYSRKTIKTTGALTADRTATLPHPATEDETYEKLWENDCTGKDLIVSTGTGLTVRLSQGARVALKFSPSGVEIASFSLAGIEVNVMDYYLASDGAPSLGTMGPGATAVTTKNLALAFERAWAAKIATRRARGIYFPPCVEYGVQAYSFKEPKTYALDNTNGRCNVYLRFSGDASIIVPDSSSAVDVKMLFASGGPAGMTTLFRVEGLTLCGVDTATNDVSCFISTTVDMEVTYEDCTFYSVQSNNVTGILRGSAMGITFRRCNFHWCANSAADGAVISVQTGTFGALFEHCNWYPWEKSVNPFGGTNYSKEDLVANYLLAIHGGGQPYTQTRAKLVHCTFNASSGRWGSILVKVDASLRVDTIHIDQCHLYGNVRRLIEARGDVGHIIIDRTRIEHNDGGGDPSIHLQASTCERLTMRGVWAGSWIKVTAETGQKSIEIIDCEGGVYSLNNATPQFDIRRSTFDTLTLPTAFKGIYLPATSTDAILHGSTGTCTPEQFGAIGDGVANDTVPMHAALDAVKAGTYGCLLLGADRTYLMDNYTWDGGAGNGGAIIGHGPTSVIKYRIANPDGLKALILARNIYSLVVKNCTLQGDDVLSQTGILLGLADSTAPQECSIENVIFRDFALKAIHTTNAPVATSQVCTMTNCRIEDCGTGIVGGAQMTLVGVNTSGCTLGWQFTAGNLTAVGCVTSENTTNFQLQASGNDGHGTVTGCTFNHATTLLEIQDIANGMTFSGCHFYAGSLSFDNVGIVDFIGCSLRPINLTATDPAKVRFLHCRIETSVIGTVSIASTCQVEFVDVRDLDGSVPAFIVSRNAIPALDIDWTRTKIHTKALASGGNTFTFSNARANEVIMVRLTSDAGGSTVTWPTVKWAGGVAPTQSTPSKTDTYTFLHDGTDIYGSVVQDLS